MSCRFGGLLTIQKFFGKNFYFQLGAEKRVGKASNRGLATKPLIPQLVISFFSALSAVAGNGQPFTMRCVGWLDSGCSEG